MRSIALLPLLALVLSAPTTAKTLATGRTADGPFPFAVHEKTLGNGLRIAVVPTGHKGMFALREIIGVGSRDEVEAGHSGFAHFFEHMMFRGTQRFSAEARGDLLESLGVNEGGSTTDDFTIYKIVGPVRALPQLVELEADRYMNLDYSVEDFKTESKAVLGEYNKSFSNPDMKAWQELRALAFDRHTYEHTTIGFLEDIQKMPERYDYSRKFFQRFYTPDNTLLLFVGDLEPAVVFQLVEEQFGKWQGKRAQVSVKAEPAQRKERRTHVAWDSPTVPRGHIAWKVPSTSDPQGAALGQVLEAYLFSESAALHQALVLDEGKLESLGSWWWLRKDPSIFPVNYRLKEGAEHDEIIGRLQGSLDAVAKGELDDARFEAVKSHVRYRVLMDLTSADNVASALGWTGGAQMSATNLDATLRAIAELKKEDLVSFVKDNFTPSRRTIVTVAHAPAASAAGGAK